MYKALAMARKLLHNLHIEYKPRNKDTSAWFIMEKEYIQVPNSHVNIMLREI